MMRNRIYIITLFPISKMQRNSICLGEELFLQFCSKESKKARNLCGILLKKRNLTRSNLNLTSINVWLSPNTRIHKRKKKPVFQLGPLDPISMFD